MKNPKKPYLVIGAGGHGKVLLDLLKASKAKVLGCLDNDKKLHGLSVENTPVLGGDEAASRFKPKSVWLVNAVGAVRDTKARRGVFEKFTAKGYVFPALRAPSAYKAESAVMEAGSQLLTRAVLHPGSRLGANALVNTAAVVEHDCRIGDHAFIGPGAVVCGGVTIEEGVFIGAGAVIFPGIRLQAESRVAAGAVVRQDVAGGALALPGDPL